MSKNTILILLAIILVAVLLDRSTIDFIKDKLPVDAEDIPAEAVSKAKDAGAGIIESAGNFLATAQAQQGTINLATLSAGSNFDFGDSINGTPIATQSGNSSSPQDPGETVVYMAFADSGTGDKNAKSVEKLVKNQDPDYIIIAGDLRYNGLSYQEAVTDLYGEYLEDSRLYSVPGNHDYSESGGIQAYEDFVTQPGNERWYNVDLGPCTFWFLDTMSAYQNAADWHAQQSWLQSGLEASTENCNIVVGHHAPKTSGVRPSGNESSASPQVDLPYKSWGAVSSIWGHHHAAETIITDDGFWYFVVGTGGGSLYGFGDPIEGSKNRLSEYGALKITANNALVKYEFLDVSGSVKFAYEQKFETVVATQEPVSTVVPTATPTPTPTNGPILLWWPAPNLSSVYQASLQQLMLTPNDGKPFLVGTVCPGSIFSVQEVKANEIVVSYKVVQVCQFGTQWVYVEYTLSEVYAKPGEELIKGTPLGSTSTVQPNLWLKVSIDDLTIDPSNRFTQ